MLLPLIRSLDLERRQLPPHTRWGAATGELLEDLDRTPDQPIASLVEYLEGIDSAHHAEALQDLIAEHLRFSWRRGESVWLEDYVALFGDRFDVLARLEALPAELVEDEFLARCSQLGAEPPTIEEYERRFPGRTDVITPLRMRLLSGRYVKLRRLGRGIAGEVWEARDCVARDSVARDSVARDSVARDSVARDSVARDSGSDSLVAIKQLRPEWAGRPEALMCFAQEAEITAGLEHGGIVQVHDFVREEGVPPYLVMELVRGHPLSDCIRDYHYPKVCRSRRERRDLWRALLGYFEALCAALSHAHARGVLHRDLKAGNVVIESNGRAVILDWGLATRAGSGAAASALGTPEYMPPEQVHGRADERSDVFGLGAILHEMLTGRPLRSWTGGARPSDWRRVVLEEPTLAPRHWNPRVRKRIEATCLQAVAPDPELRHQSVDELLRALTESRAGSGNARHRLRHLLERVP